MGAEEPRLGMGANPVPSPLSPTDGDGSWSVRAVSASPCDDDRTSAYDDGSAGETDERPRYRAARVGQSSIGHADRGVAAGCLAGVYGNVTIGCRSEWSGESDRSHHSETAEARQNTAFHW